MATPCPNQSSSSSYSTDEVDGCTILTSEIVGITTFTAENTDENATTGITPVFKITYSCNGTPGHYSLDMTVLAPDGVTTISYFDGTIAFIEYRDGPTDPGTFNYLTFIDGITSGTPVYVAYNNHDGTYSIYLPALPGTELPAGDVTLTLFN